MKKTTLAVIFAVLASNAALATAHAEGPMDHHKPQERVVIVKKPVHHVVHHPKPRHHAPKREVIIKHEPVRHG
ncbi:hypothetical protein SC206_04440 [Rouxiella sp. T17]|uniref:hypothetical protein n=1 Tax=Rouxiella sp. T17 TaxID=3085684 RepID=UPI002FCABAE4